MRLLPALGFAALAACSVEPAEENAAQPAPSTTAAASAAPRPEPIETPATAPTPGELKTFSDWIVGCDNTKVCTLASLGPEAGAFPDVTMEITRQPGPTGAFEIAFDAAESDDPVQPVAVTVDGERIALAELSGEAPARAVAAMANGRQLTVLGSGDRPRGRISLNGASAALRWVDAQQGRAGTVTAAVAKGERPAGAVPERRPAPVIDARTATGTPARPSAQQLAAMRTRAGCEDRRMADGDLFKPETHPLGGGATLVLVPCSAGAYNLSSALFVFQDGEVAPVRTDAPSGFDATGAKGEAVPSVVNTGWKEGELTSYAKGRGLGDCGVMQSFVWDGRRLRLSEQREMGECRGNPNYITTWRAQVIRR